MQHSAKWGVFPWTGEMMTGQRPLSLHECEATPRMVGCFFSASQWNIITGKWVCLIRLCRPTLWNGPPPKKNWAINNNCMKHKCKYCRPWLEQKHKADYSFQSQGRKSGVTRVRKPKKWGHQMATASWRKTYQINVRVSNICYDVNVSLCSKHAQILNLLIQNILIY